MRKRITGVVVVVVLAGAVWLVCSSKYARKSPPGRENIAREQLAASRNSF